MRGTLKRRSPKRSVANMPHLPRLHSVIPNVGAAIPSGSLGFCRDGRERCDGTVKLGETFKPPNIGISGFGFLVSFDIKQMPMVWPKGEGRAAVSAFGFQ